MPCEMGNGRCWSPTLRQTQWRQRRFRSPVSGAAVCGINRFASPRCNRLEMGTNGSSNPLSPDESGSYGPRGAGGWPINPLPSVGARLRRAKGGSAPLAERPRRSFAPIFQSRTTDASSVWHSSTPEPRSPPGAKYRSRPTRPIRPQSDPGYP